MQKNQAQIKQLEKRFKSRAMFLININKTQGWDRHLNQVTPVTCCGNQQCLGEPNDIHNKVLAPYITQLYTAKHYV